MFGDRVRNPRGVGGYNNRFGKREKYNGYLAPTIQPTQNYWKILNCRHVFLL